MKILFDTHSFIWWYNEPSRLSKRVLDHCYAETTTLILSALSVWEMQIKLQIGKLRFTVPLRTLIEE